MYTFLPLIEIDIRQAQIKCKEYIKYNIVHIVLKKTFIIIINLVELGLILYVYDDIDFRNNYVILLINLNYHP